MNGWINVAKERKADAEEASAAFSDPAQKRPRHKSHSDAKSPLFKSNASMADPSWRQVMDQLE